MDFVEKVDYFDLDNADSIKSCLQTKKGQPCPSLTQPPHEEVIL